MKNIEAETDTTVKRMFFFTKVYYISAGQTNLVRYASIKKQHRCKVVSGKSLDWIISRIE